MAYKIKRRYYVTNKQLTYLTENGYRKEIRDNARRELVRRKNK